MYVLLATCFVVLFGMNTLGVLLKFSHEILSIILKGHLLLFIQNCTRKRDSICLCDVVQ